ncbi:TonB-dependent receptor [Sphingobacterium sp. SGR-19]|uniref:TonB-dependent receptor n=1 Tax=Sphingobacterium sp. SGR-19 TaxID=2710886 RepID=UPI0013EC07AE|nr:TonB-dependent receptor [Sphingobacterium sp. SGR-19]NGM64993.1 TonB-dependent receptor [Sphingobacterium sp. SGR-19]
MNKQIFLLLLSIIPLALFSQTGRITGTITDENTNATITGVSVMTIGGTQAASSDFEGKYTIEVAPGTYTVLFSYIGYASKEITDVKVTEGKATIVDIALAPSSDELEAVVVSVSARQNTEASILNMQKNAGIVMDGLSSQSMKRVGASDIAAAVKIVPGVSVQEGKYVYVRGLGDRYTKTTLNGLDIPGLDPDKNTVQMDIFPTGVLENIIVKKSASAELPADFTGGVVDIVTKDIPTQKQIGLSLSLGYNPNMHFKDNFVSYKGSATDFLGFDNGDRKLPVANTYEIPNVVVPANKSTVESVTKAFNPLLGAERKTNSMPDLSLAFDFSNQYDLWGNKLGVIGVLNYKKTTSFYEGYKNNIYQKPNQTDPSSELRPDQLITGDLGEQNVLLSGMLGLNYKTQRSKYSLNLLHIQNGESRSAMYDQVNRIANSNELYKNVLDYSERSISNILLSGKHSNEDADFITEWKVSPSLSRVNDKDVRVSTFLLDGTGNYVMATDADLPVRIWRSLEEINVVSKVDFTKKLEFFERDAALKFGGLYSYKQRDYRINDYQVNYRNIGRGTANGDFNAILSPENIYDADTDKGFYMLGSPQAANIFDASQHTAAAYGSLEVNPWEKFRAIVGLRAEQYTSFFTGENVERVTYDNVKTINNFDFFPSLNLIYNPYSNHNLRASYSRTTARPSFKELSVIQIYDPISNTYFLGNLDLVPTYINNMDLRYEIFGEQAQMIAVSAFYKRFQDPIEIQAFSSAARHQFIARNSGTADVYGLEFEMRKNFGFVSEALRDMSFNLNASVVKSSIEMGDSEYQSRVLFARDGEKVDRKRELQGQSPYLVNAGLSYNNGDNGFEAGVFYNVQGKTLEFIGFSQNSDIYVKPFNSLNVNIGKKLGPEFRWGTVSLKVDNLLDSKRMSVYEAYMAADQIYSLRAPRRTFTLGYSYNF